MSKNAWLFEMTPESRLRVTHKDQLLKSVLVRIPRNAYAVRLGRSLPNRLADLVDLAVLAYTADRLAPRQQTVGRVWQSPWLRRMTLRVPVRDLTYWSQPTVVDSLQTCLAYFTEDDWSFEFSPRERVKDHWPVQRFLPSEAPAAAALFSGGLDSLAGVALDLETLEGRSLVLVSCTASSRLIGKQRELLSSLRRRGSNILPIVLPCSISQTSKSYNSNERSQRTRGFLFGCLGAVAAVQVGLGSLRIYENGIGAINLPISPAQLGVHATRATHPRALLYLSRFLSRVFSRPFEIQLPYGYTTKGDMCLRLAETRWRDLACRTISCDSFPLRRSDGEQCGICTSCLLRRQALFTGGFTEDQQKDLYRFDAIEAPENIPNDKQRPLADMLMQVSRLRRVLASSNPFEELQIEFPEIARVSSIRPNQQPDEHRRKIVELYARYCHEWQDFPAHPTGWDLAAA